MKACAPPWGIAAIQLGIPKALIAVSVPTEEGSDEFALANPRIVSESVQNAYLAQGEGCLSVAEEHEGLVWRHARITVTGYDLLRKDFIRVRAEGYTAICLQHEIDHLSGILFYDRINKDDPWKEDPQAEVLGCKPRDTFRAPCFIIQREMVDKTDAFFIIDD